MLLKSRTISPLQKGGNMKQYNNSDIKKLMKEKNVSQYDISVALNVSEMTVFRMLRRPLTDAERSDIIHIIEKLSKNN